MCNPIRPPFTLETALAKVQAAEDAWNTRDPQRVSMAYAENSERRNRTAVRFEYEWHDESGQWYRSYGNEIREFDEQGLMARRYASMNDAPIRAQDRRAFAR